MFCRSFGSSKHTIKAVNNVSRVSNLTVYSREMPAEYQTIISQLLATRVAFQVKQKPTQKRSLEIIGAPVTFGQPMMGVDRGSKIIRQSGLYRDLSLLQWHISENGDMGFDEPSPKDPQIAEGKGQVVNCFAAGKACHKIARTVSKSLGKMNLEDHALMIGGDASMSIGSIAGILKNQPKTGIVWVSTRAGFDTPLTTTTSHLHRMTLSMLTKGVVKHENLPGFEWLGKDGGFLNDSSAFNPGFTIDDENRFPNLLDPSQITCLALRQIEQAEASLIKKLGIQCYTMDDIDKDGIGAVMEKVIAHHHKDDLTKPLHLCFDVNAIDPTVAPATFTTVPGGLTLREANHVAESLFLTGCLRTVDLVELNPTLGNYEEVKKTVDVALGVICAAFGQTILTLKH